MMRGAQNGPNIRYFLGSLKSKTVFNQWIRKQKKQKTLNNTFKIKFEFFYLLLGLVLETTCMLCISANIFEQKIKKQSLAQFAWTNWDVGIHSMCPTLVISTQKCAFESINGNSYTNFENASTRQNFCNFGEYSHSPNSKWSIEVVTRSSWVWQVWQK